MRIFITTLLFALITSALGQVKFRIEQNLPYCVEGKTDSLRQLNLVIPYGVQLNPLLIWIGGGAWSYVDRHVEMDMAKKLAQEGIAVATIGHRLSPATWKDPTLNSGIKHPTHAEDIASAVAWLVANAPKYSLDTSQLFIGGFSSGAHLATLVAWDHSFLSKHGLKAHHLFKGILPFSGAYDIQQYYDVIAQSDRPELAASHVEAVFGKDHDLFEIASPVTYMKNAHAPMLVFCDEGLYSYTHLLQEALRAIDFQSVTFIYVPLGHGALWRSLSFNQNSIYREHMVQFIRDQSR